MSKCLDILCLEDQIPDYELILGELRKEWLSFLSRRIETEAELRLALAQQPPDLIIADYSLAGFNGLGALAIARELCPDIPFVFVTSDQGEELAIEALKQGATDYVLKQRLGRLGPAVQRALKERSESLGHQIADARVAKLNQCLLSFRADPIENIKSLLRLCGELFGAGFGIYGRTNTGCLEVVATWNFPEEHLGLEEKISQDVFRRLFKFCGQTSPMRIGPAVSSEDSAILSQCGIASQVSLPVTFGGKNVGVLALFYRAELDPSTEDLKFLSLVASAVGVEEDRIVAESALRNNEERYRALIENSADCLALVNREDCIIEISPSVTREFGYTEADVLGHPISEFLHPAEMNTVFERLRLIKLKPRGSDRATFRVLHRDGSWRWIDASFSNLVDEPALKSIIINFRDISSRIKAEERIRDQADLLDQVQDAIGLRDMDNRMLFWNKGAERMYGWTAEEVIGRRSTEFFYKTVPAVRSEAQQTVMEKGEWHGEIKQITKAGKDIIVNSRWKLVRNAEGVPQAILVVNTDITEQKHMEDKFLRAQRLEAIGTLASGISHDLNNILSPILISTQLLHTKELDEEARNLLGTIEQCAVRGSEVVKQVLTLGRGLKGERITVQPRYIVSEMGKIARETFPKSIRIETQAAPDLWHVLGDTTQLHQVLLNLCVNARDAMPDGGVLRIAAQNQHIDEHFAKMSPAAKTGDFVMLQVSDTGHGIAPDILDHIFDPFFTTKEAGKGTGLGLSTVLGIVEKHGGFMMVDSTPGKGSSFRVYLPALPESGPPVSVRKPESLPVGQGEMILVVDDEKDIREVTRKILTRHQYEVIVAEDGADGVSQFALNQDRVKLVLTDVMMPVMDGLALVRALRKIDPRIRIVASSGLLSATGQAEKVAELHNLGVVTILSKPFNSEKLLKTIADELTRQRE